MSYKVGQPRREFGTSTQVELKAEFHSHHMKKHIYCCGKESCMLEEKNKVCTTDSGLSCNVMTKNLELLSQNKSDDLTSLVTQAAMPTHL